MMWQFPQSLRWGLMAVLLGAGCGRDEPTGPLPHKGVITISTVTQGVNFDPDGYEALLDHVAVGRISTSGFFVMQDVEVGPHYVSLIGLAPNCVLRNEAPVYALITSDANVGADFSIDCYKDATKIIVITSTAFIRAGASQASNPGYTVFLDGAASRHVDVEGSVTFGGVSAGPHTIQLVIPNGCGFLQQPTNFLRDLSIAQNEVRVVNFELVCFG